MTMLNHGWRSAGVVAAWLLVSAAVAVADAQALRLRQAPARLMDGYPVAHLTSGDIDGDGLVDLAAITFQTYPDQNIADKVLIQFQGPSAETDVEFRDGAVLPAQAPQGLLLADLDGDGDLDIAVAQDNAADALAIWINAGAQADPQRVLFRRLQQNLSYDLASGIVAFDGDADPATPPDLLLVRGTGRPSVLLQNQLASAVPRVSERQLLDHPSAVGALSADFDGDDRDDLLVYGDGCRMWRHASAAPQSSLQPSTLSACDGQAVFAAAARDLSVAPGHMGIALGTPSGDRWLVVSSWPGGQNPVATSALLSTQATGFTAQFAFIDADGDGKLDLIAARRNENAFDPVQRGSPVYRQQPDGTFGSTLQLLAPAWTAVVLPALPGSASGLALGHVSASSGLWQSALPSGVLPKVAFPYPKIYVPGPGFAAPLRVTPSTEAPVTGVYVDAVSGNGAHAVLTGDFGVGLRDIYAVAAGVTAIYPDMRTLTLSSVVPPGAGTIDTPSSATLFVLSPTLPTNSCFVGLWNFLMALHGDAPMQPVGGIDPVVLLQRLRDERMATTAGGQYYISLYQSLQSDLYIAAFADPGFYLLLWDLQQAWLPAFADLIDGDGQRPVTAAMVDLLARSLTRFQAHGSARLYDAIARERAALDLDALAGLPIASFQQRWEAGPIFADGFD